MKSEMNREGRRLGKKRVAALMIALVAGFAMMLTACGSSDTTEETTAAPETAATEATTAAPATEATTAAPANNTGDPQITEQQAKDIALGSAGLSENQAQMLTCHLDWDDGVQVYEIEFAADGFEYDYTIDANSGNILEQDKGIID